MAIFNEEKFEDNAIADNTCEQLFSGGKTTKFKKGGKVEKKKRAGKDNKKQEKLKNIEKNVANNKSVNLLHKSELIKKNEKVTKTNQKNFKEKPSKAAKVKKQMVKTADNTPTSSINTEILKNEIQQLLNGELIDESNLPPLKIVKKPQRKAPIDIPTDSAVETKKKRKKGKTNQLKESIETDDLPKLSLNPKKNRVKQKLQNLLQNDSSHEEPAKKKTKFKDLPLREKMMEKLKSARFRLLNEQIYSTDSREAQKIFNSDPTAFNAYHEGYRQQVAKWPLNPVDTIIESIKKMSKSFIIADFGCGEAKLAKSVVQTVHSFDLVAVNDRVTACDMAHVPLKSNSVDVVVFCLSLMGTNLHEYLKEANRVLKQGGILKIAEVESRFDDVNQFIEGVKRFNLKLTWKDLSHNLFYFMDFKKEANIGNKKKLPTIGLHPCLYKKR